MPLLDEGSWTIREASIKRLEEQRQREREERSRIGWEELAQRVKEHRRREEVAAAETRLPGTSTWQVNITGGVRSQQDLPEAERMGHAAPAASGDFDKRPSSTSPDEMETYITALSLSRRPLLVDS